ncbi:MAG TPA: nuclear transport factor 2 family protein [Pyrinomonadaceae bacterium]|nr:nuclear transport factor 2 family protein [Pyrinomonadaceae bacterium]
MKNNVEIVKEGYDKFAKGDISGLLSLMADSIRWSTPEIEGTTLGGIRNGHEGVGEFFRILDETETVTKFEPREFIGEGDRVAVIGTYGATVKETGRSYEVEWAQFFTVRDGKIASFDEYLDSAIAAKAFQKALPA